MKNRIVALFNFSLIILFIFISLYLPALVKLSVIEQPIYEEYRYWLVIVSYICLILTISLNEQGLKKYNLDRGSIILLIFAGFFRVSLGVSHENTYRLIIVMLSLCLLYIFILKKDKIETTNWYWVLWAVILSLSLALMLSFLESLQNARYTASSAYTDNNLFFIHAVSNFLYQVSFVAPYEELVVRVFLWGRLRDARLSDKTIMVLQAFFFWFLHVGQADHHISFFLGIPLATLILTVLVRKSEQIFPSMVAHILINFSIPIFLSLYSR